MWVQWQGNIINPCIENNCDFCLVINGQVTAANLVSGTGRPCTFYVLSCCKCNNWGQLHGVTFKWYAKCLCHQFWCKYLIGGHVNVTDEDESLCDICIVLYDATLNIIFEDYHVRNISNFKSCIIWFVVLFIDHRDQIVFGSPLMQRWSLPMELHQMVDQINCWCRFSVGSSFWLAICERTTRPPSTYSRRLDHSICSENYKNLQSWWNQGYPKDHFRLRTFVVYFYHWCWHVSSLANPCSWTFWMPLSCRNVERYDRKIALTLPPVCIIV